MKTSSIKRTAHGRSAALLASLALSLLTFPLCGATPYVAYIVPAGTVGNQFLPAGEPQSLGMDFDVNSPIVITSLGVFDSGGDGLVSSLTVHLYDRDTQLSLAQLVFTTTNAGTLVGGSRFLALHTPLRLESGFHGVIAVDYTTAHNELNGNWRVSPGNWTTDTGGGAIGFVGSGRIGYGAGGIFPNLVVSDAPSNCFAAGTFMFTPTEPAGPTIVHQPQNYTATLGGSAAFSVTVSGSPPLSYQWLFSGDPIPGASQQSLTLFDVRADQAGRYSVRVTNSVGSVTSDEALLVVRSNLPPEAVAYVVPADTVGNQFLPAGEPQSLGMDFDVNSPIVITSLGVFDSGSDGLTSQLTAHIYDRDTQISLAQLDFTPGNPGAAIDGSRFLPLEIPLRLEAGFHGVIAVDYVTQNNEWNGNLRVSPGGWTTDSGGGLISFVGTSRHSFMGTGAVFPDIIEDNCPANCYAAGTFIFGSAPLPSVPTISSFAPRSGPIGTSVTITGSNFSPTLEENIVYFGAVRATVTAASETALTVTVPLGATYAPACVTVGGLTACAQAPFVVTFVSSGVIDANSLSSRLDIPGGDGPMQVVVADLDADGKPDLAMVSRFDSVLTLYRNTGHGGFGADSWSDGGHRATAVDPVHMVAADIDGDGLLDLIVVNHTSGVIAGATDTVSVFRNTSTRGTLDGSSFADRIDFPVGAVPQHVAVGDLDGDGRPDIVVANFGSGTISLLQNRSTPGHIALAQKIDLTTAYGAHTVEIGDLDGDGKLDLVVGNHENDLTSIFRNTSTVGIIGPNSFAPKVDFAGSGKTIAIGDLDGDGKPDVVAGSWRLGRLSVFRNTSQPGQIGPDSFAPRIEFSAEGYAHTVVIGDLDGDGRPDLALVTEMPSHLSLFQNLSSPGSLTTSSFGPRIDFGAGWNAVGVCIGDLDSDGKPDLVFANHYDDSITLYKNVIPVNTAPTILESPQDEAAVAGTSVQFTVRATGAPAPTLQWLFDGDAIADATEPALTLDNVQPAMAGFYSVVVSNIFGSVTSQVARLTVVPSRTLALTSPSAAQEGTTISVPLDLISEGDVGGMNFVLHYDGTYLRNPQLSWSPLLQGLFNTINDSIPGEIHATFAFSGDAIPAGTQSLASLHFLLRSVPEDLDVPLTLEIEDVSSPAGDPITLGNLTRGATVRIQKRQILGDNNANQRLDVGDATVILRLLAQLDTPRSWDVTGNDLNGNQKLDTGDAIKVLRAAAGVDPQPGGALAPALARSASKSPAASTELMLLSPASQRSNPGDLVTFQVQLQGVLTPISGAAFTLDYPTNALRFLSSASYRFGPLVPGGSLAVWNLAPAQNDLAMQSGHISLAVSSATAWPASNGVLAEVTFQVQPGATNRYTWPIGLSQPEITQDGLRNRFLFPQATTFIGRNPLPGSLSALPQRLSDHFQFSFIGDPGVGYIVEVSTNLVNWTSLTNFLNSSGSLSISDANAKNFPHRFYRARPQN